MKFWSSSLVTNFNSDEGLNGNNPFEMKRINILVGSNNSGKSRFMRAIISVMGSKSLKLQRPQSYIVMREDLKEFLSETSGLILQNEEFNSIELESFDNILSELGNLRAFLRSLIEQNFAQQPDIASEYRQKYARNFQLYYSRLAFGNWHTFVEKIRAFTDFISSDEMNNEFKILKKLSEDSSNLFYIPSSRSLKKFHSSLDEVIFDAKHPLSNYFSTETKEQRENTKKFLINKPFTALTHFDYNIKDSQIITGEGFFEDIMQSLLGKPAERKRVIEYQEKISHYFFNNQEVTIIPNVKENALEIKIGNDEQYPIAHLGDGLQQVIILTYTPFLKNEQSMFFIEEPEMHLHAGYVKQIIKFLLNETNHTYFMTTHSNYLLDMINESNQITLYRVDKKQILEDDSTRIETVIKRCDKDRSVLQVLGVKPSSVFLANCTIWIEGITDRLYLVEYMKKYLKELKDQDEEKYYNYSRYIDGYHYAFVEYQGANLAHWNFETELINDVDSGKENGLNALLVTSEALVIADSDLTGKPRFEEIKNQLGFNLQITRGKETENTLPKEILVEMFYQLCPANGRSGGKTKLTKDENHLSHFKDNFEISSKGIGKYFDDTLTRLRKANIIESLTENDKAYKFSDSKSKQGTIKKKTEFCRSAIELMQDENFEWKLTESARELCEAIFNHIEKCNKEFEN